MDVLVLEGFMSQSFSSLVDQFDMYLPNYWKNALLQSISFLHEIQIHKAILLHNVSNSTIYIILLVPILLSTCFDRFRVVLLWQ